VDPMESKYAGMSGYNYCYNNPVMVIDPDGKDPKDGEIPATEARRNNTKKEYDFLTGKVTNAFQRDAVVKDKKEPKESVTTVDTQSPAKGIGDILLGGASVLTNPGIDKYIVEEVGEKVFE